MLIEIPPKFNMTCKKKVQVGVCNMNKMFNITLEGGKERRDEKREKKEML